MRLTFTRGFIGNPNEIGVDGNPTWSPDGRKLVFNSNRDGDFEVYVMNADGSEQTNLTNHPALDAFGEFRPTAIRSSS